MSHARSSSGNLKKKMIKTDKRTIRNTKGSKNFNWKGGRKYSRGHIMIYMPNHPKSVKNYVAEHRFIMEQHLGRILKRHEYVHHINEKQDDNRLENLILTNASEHIEKYHKNM